MSTREIRKLLRLIQLWLDRPPLTELAPLTVEHQALRQQAIMSIAHMLQGLGQAAWISPVLDWLSQYDGLELVVFKDQDPVLLSAEALAGLVQQRAESGVTTAVTPTELADKLASQSFCDLRARMGYEGQEWDPSAERFMDYLTKIKPVVIPHVWSTGYAPAGTTALRERLIEKLTQTQNPPTLGSPPGGGSDPIPE
ncbi:hypothetical protein [Uliginosibacterium gangwonense]|uniref:hypothetical protein n=1 Tax=Uliginosibacterium gangwonense TaxID=392736 RepID=UPI0012F82CE8|nr:hypothetical protein [Uliginosibacterium gangwonense]